MRVLLGVAMVAGAAGLASMAHLTASSTWLVLLPGFILAGIGLGITSTGVAVLGALYVSRVTTATLHALAGLPAPPGAAHRLASAVASGAGTRVAAAVPPAARAAVTHAGGVRHRQRLERRPARCGRVRRARRGSRIRLRTRPGQAAAAQPCPRRPRPTDRPAAHRPAPGPATGRARNNGTITS